MEPTWPGGLSAMVAKTMLRRGVGTSSSQRLFSALLKQDNAQELEIKHNETIKGHVTSHQIDVSWKFRMGGDKYAGIV